MCHISSQIIKNVTISVFVCLVYCVCLMLSENSSQIQKYLCCGHKYHNISVILFNRYYVDSTF